MEQHLWTSTRDGERHVLSTSLGIERIGGSWYVVRIDVQGYAWALGSVPYRTQEDARSAAEKMAGREGRYAKLLRVAPPMPADVVQALCVLVALVGFSLDMLKMPFAGSASVLFTTVAWFAGAAYSAQTEKRS